MGPIVIIMSGLHYFFKRINVISVKNRITCKDIVPYTLFLNNDMKLYSHIIIPKLMKIENSNSPNPL